MNDAHTKRTRDPNQLAKLAVAIATGEIADAGEAKHAAAQALGTNDGAVRAGALPAGWCAEITRKAAKSRWCEE